VRDWEEGQGDGIPLSLSSGMASEAGRGRRREQACDRQPGQVSTNRWEGTLSAARLAAQTNGHLPLAGDGWDTVVRNRARLATGNDWD